jgi:hypothetical protein
MSRQFPHHADAEDRLLMGMVQNMQAGEGKAHDPDDIGQRYRL